MIWHVQQNVVKCFIIQLPRFSLVIFQRVIMVATCDVFGCTNSRKDSSGLSLHRIPAANAENKLLQERWIQNIHRPDPLPKNMPKDMKTFIFVRTISKQIASNET